MATKAEQEQAARETSRLKLREEHGGAWIPVHPGDTIIGRVLTVDSGWSDQKNAPYPILALDAESATGYENPGELVVHGMGTVLHNELVKRQPLPGERVKITYVGPGGEAVKGRNRAQIFRVQVAGRNAEQEAARLYGSMRPIGRNGQAGELAGLPPSDSQVSQLEAGQTGFDGGEEDLPF